MKDVEKIIIGAILSQKSSVSLPRNTDINEIKAIIRKYMRNYPEVFWFSHQYKWDEDSYTLSFKYNFSPRKKAFFAEEINKAVEYLFQPDKLSHLSELQKVEYVYKWIVSNTTYNEYSSFNQTIYSVLINRNSVCTGYAKTAQYLLRLLNVESQLIFGKFHADKSEGGRHGWNIVRIDDDWYHVDFCLADPSLKQLLNSDEKPIEYDGLLWNYFCRSTEYVLRNRSIEFIDAYPKCVKSIDNRFDIRLFKPKKRLVVCKSDSGTSAKVYLDSYDKKSVIKVTQSNRSLIDTEIEVFQNLKDCKHVVQYKGYIEDGILLEQLTPWSELLNSHYYHPDEKQLKDILIQLTEGLIECRDKGIAYSDIHYNNVFVSSEGIYKWGDFGIAYSFEKNGAMPPHMIGEDGIALGSRWFMSPETYHNRMFTESSAIYSLAILAYFVMNDMRPPFWNPNCPDDSLGIYLKFNKAFPTPNLFSGRLWNFMTNNCLCHNYQSRISTLEAFKVALELDLLDSKTYDIELAAKRQKLKAKLLSEGKISPIADGNSIGISFSKGKLAGEVIASLSGNDDEYCCDSDVFAKTNMTSEYEKWGDGLIHDTDSFARTCGFGQSRPPIPLSELIEEKDAWAHDTDSFAQTYVPNLSGGPEWVHVEASPAPTLENAKVKPIHQPYETYRPQMSKQSFFKRLFAKKQKEEAVSATAFAPNSITPLKDFLIRVFLHKPEESSSIDTLVESIDKDAVKKANRPLDIQIKDGDEVTIMLILSDRTSIDEPIQRYTWRGQYIESDFFCNLSQENLQNIRGKVIIAINNAPAGELKFLIDVRSRVETTGYAKMDTKRYSKIFISYAHADYPQVRGIAEGCRINGSDYFFDRHTLKAGDIFKEKILKYIDNADLFVLCWSKNAAESEWVQIERKHALDVIERGNNQLAIYPLSMPPEAPLPEDMSDKYNFATL